MTPINEFITAWWPVVAGIWTLVSGVATIYARSVAKQLAELKLAVSQQDQDLDAYKLEVAKTYMPSSDIKELVNDLKAFLIRIEDKVDGRRTQ